MALVGAKGIALIVLFLVSAGIIEYVIILHIYSGQRWVQFSDPKISDGFSKVEVENLEARYKKIKFFPGGGAGSNGDRKDSEYWSKKRNEILSVIGKGGEDDDMVNVQAPPSVKPKKGHEQEVNNEKERVQQQDGSLLSNEQNVVGDGNRHGDYDREVPLEMEKRIDQEKQVEDGELGVVKRAIGKKREDYNYDDNGDMDEHGRPKEKGNVIEEVAYDMENGNWDVQKQSTVGEPGGMFETAVKALSALSGFKKMVQDAFKGKSEEEKEGAKNEGEAKEGGKGLNEGGTHNKSSLMDQNYDQIFEQNSEFFNGHAMDNEPLIERDKLRHFRPLSAFEAAGNNIMFTLRTTKPFHDKRLPLLFETWMRKANHSNIFIVTDGEDKKWIKKTWDESKVFIGGKLPATRGVHVGDHSVGK